MYNFRFELFMVEKLNYESFLDSPTCLASSPRGRIGEASNAISELGINDSRHNSLQSLSRDSDSP